MAIGTTGAVDPMTGERTETQFEYTPVDPQEDMMRQAFERSQQAFFPPPPQPQGPTPYWENPETYYPRQRQIDPIEQAKASTAAAYKYIAFRGYQQDLKEGKSAAESFAKWGPMLVQDTSLAPAMKAMQPAPNYTYDQAHNAWTSPGQKPVLGRPVTTPPQFVRANEQTGEPAHYISDGKAQFLPNTTAPKLDQITMADYKNAQDEFEVALKEYRKDDNPEEIKVEARKRMDAAKIRMNNIASRGKAPQAAPQPAPVAPKQQSAPETPITITVTTKEQFDKLPSGAIYLNKGKKYRKP